MGPTSSAATPARPVLLTVDDDPSVSRAVAPDLRRHLVTRIEADPANDVLTCTQIARGEAEDHLAAGAGGTLVLRTARDGEHLLVEVGDDGPGIAPDVAGRVFQAFLTTTKAPDAGSGLGRGGATRIVARRHHGELGFRPDERGTTCTVRRPLVQDLQ